MLWRLFNNNLLSKKGAGKWPWLGFEIKWRSKHIYWITLKYIHYMRTERKLMSNKTVNICRKTALELYRSGIGVLALALINSVSLEKSNSFFSLNFLIYKMGISSVQLSCSVLSNSLRPHESQHARPPCPSPTPGVYSNPCPSSRWCHPAISSSVIPFSSCLQSLLVSGSFQMSHFFTSDGQSIGGSASTSVLPMNTRDWSPLGWTGWISLQSKELSRVFSNTTVLKHQFFGLSFLHSPTLTSIHDHWKNHSLD